MTDLSDAGSASTSPQGSVAEIHRFPVKSMLGERLEHVEIGLSGLAGDRAYALVDTTDGVVASAKRPRRWGRLLEARATFVDEPTLGGDPPPVLIELPDGTTVRSDDGEVHSTLSAFLGRDVRLTSGDTSGLQFHEVWPDIDGLAPADFIDQSRLDQPDPDDDGADETDADTEADGVSISAIGVAGLAPGAGFFDLTTLHVLTTSTLDALHAEDAAATFDVRRYRPNVLVRTDEAGFVENGWAGRVVCIGPDVRANGVIPTMRCVMTTLAVDGLPADRATLQTIARVNRLEIPGLGTWACAGLYANVSQGGSCAVGDAVGLLA